jgi:hypothetical protein
MLYYKMPPLPSLNLDYEKSSFLANAVFGEVINIKCLKALVEIYFLQDNYDINNYSSKLASRYYKNEKEQFNLQCWALTAETIIDVDSWKWLFKNSGYTGDYEFIYFE